MLIFWGKLDSAGLVVDEAVNDDKNKHRKGGAVKLTFDMAYDCAN